jgi:pectin methylesterase-like acyl-CoA thioesterase
MIMRNDILRKGLVFGILLLFVTVSIVLALNANPSSNSTSAKLGNWLYVGGSGPGNYTTIQSAIDTASPNDTVFVYDDSSPYFEHVNITESIHLIGENRDTTIIDGNDSGNVLIVYFANWIDISGFTIRNSGQNEFDAGVEFLGGMGGETHHISLINCRVHNNTNGVFIYHSL